MYTRNLSVCPENRSTDEEFTVWSVRPLTCLDAVFDQCVEQITGDIVASTTAVGMIGHCKVLMMYVLLLYKQ